MTGKDQLVFLATILFTTLRTYLDEHFKVSHVNSQPVGVLGMVQGKKPWQKLWLDLCLALIAFTNQAA
jgi:hypothetical protein